MVYKQIIRNSLNHQPAPAARGDGIPTSPTALRNLRRIPSSLWSRAFRRGLSSLVFRLITKKRHSNAFRRFCPFICLENYWMNGGNQGTRLEFSAAIATGLEIFAHWVIEKENAASDEAKNVKGSFIQIKIWTWILWLRIIIDFCFVDHQHWSSSLTITIGHTVFYTSRNIIHIFPDVL